MAIKHPDYDIDFKPAIARYDWDQTYDVLEFVYLPQGFSSLMDLCGIPAFELMAIDRFTPYNYRWADQYSEEIYYFLKRFNFCPYLINKCLIFMALSDRKIPILTGVNDVPSTDGGANHPNGSLLCANFNSLIDDIPAEVQALARQAISATGDATYDSATGVINVTASAPVSISSLPNKSGNIYVNDTTGDDINGDGEWETPFATIERCIDYLTGFKITNKVTINITGTFTNPNIDLRKLEPNLNIEKNSQYTSSSLDTGINLSGDGTAIINYTEDTDNFLYLNKYGTVIKDLTLNIDIEKVISCHNTVLELSNLVYTSANFYGLFNCMNSGVSIKNITTLSSMPNALANGIKNKVIMYNNNYTAKPLFWGGYNFYYLRGNTRTTGTTKIATDLGYSIIFRDASTSDISSNNNIILPS